MIRFGGPIFNKAEDPHELARAYKAFGYTAAVCPKIDLDDEQRISRTRIAFEEEGVMLAESHAWCNIISPDAKTRQENRERVCEALALADELDARCAVTFIGTLDPDSAYGPHPDNLTDEGFIATVEAARDVIDSVKPKRAKFTLEMMQWTYPDSVDSYVELIRAIDRPAFGVHLDPVNIIVSPRQYFDTTDVIRECFYKLGPHIMSCHAKDLKLRSDLALHLDEVPPLMGNLDYRVYLAELKKMDRDMPLILEHLSGEDEYRQALDRLKKLEAEI